LAGLTRAKAMTMRSQRIRARQAFEWGIATGVAPDNDLDAAINRWVEELTELPRIPLTALKRVLSGAYEMPMSIGVQFRGADLRKAARRAGA
jgi:2-oxoglutaroyl-CoA hydrolase